MYDQPGRLIVHSVHLASEAKHTLCTISHDEIGNSLSYYSGLGESIKAKFSQNMCPRYTSLHAKYQHDACSGYLKNKTNVCRSGRISVVICSVLIREKKRNNPQEIDTVINNSLIHAPLPLQNENIFKLEIEYCTLSIRRGYSYKM